jgi:hypothetical protein
MSSRMVVFDHDCMVNKRGVSRLWLRYGQAKRDTMIPRVRNSDDVSELCVVTFLWVKTRGLFSTIEMAVCK